MPRALFCVRSPWRPSPGPTATMIGWPARLAICGRSSPPSRTCSDLSLQGAELAVGKSAAEPQTPDVRAGRVRRACDDAPLSFPVRLCDAPYLLQLPSQSGVRKSAHASKILNVSRTEITERIPRRSATDVRSDPE